MYDDMAQVIIFHTPVADFQLFSNLFSSSETIKSEISCHVFLEWGCKILYKGDMTKMIITT